VYKCDVFIGLLNRRWGSDTGLYTSGFEEEFEVVLRRREAGGTPSIGMFFAELPADAVADPGTQLQAVLSFQERVRAEGIALYKQYRTTDHLATEVLDFLTGHALDLASQAVGERGGDEGVAPTGNTDPAGTDHDRTATTSPQAPVTHDSAQASDAATATGATPPETNDAAQQIADALRGFATVFDPSAEGLATVDRDRITLVGTAFATDEGLLGTHHVNRLYRRRDDLKLTNGEGWAWLRTYFVDRHADRANRTVPVWALFHPLTEDGKDFRDDLVMMAGNDDVRVSRGAVAFMTEHRVRPPGLWPTDPRTDQQEDEQDGHSDEEGSTGGAAVGVNGSRDNLDDGPTPTEAAVSSWKHIYSQVPGVGVAANYMIAVATEDDLHLLDALAEDDEIGESSKSVIVAVAASLRGDPKPLAMLAPSRYIDGVDLLIDRILAAVPDLGETEWDNLLTSRHPKLVVPAGIELVGLGKLEKSDLVDYLKVNDARLDAVLAEKAAADSDLCAELVTLLRERKDLDDGDVRTARLLSSVLPREALEQFHANEPYQQTTWEALTIQDPVGMVAQAREVLDDQAEFLQQKVAPLLDQYESLAQHIITDCKRSAYALLAKVATQDTIEERSADLERAIDELRRGSLSTRHVALTAIAALVDDNTADRVPVALIDGYWVTGHIEELAASPLAAHLIPQWRTSGVSDLQSAAEAWFIQRPERTDEELVEATYADDMKVRIVAIDAIISRWSRDQVIDLLGRYDQQQRPYWYNVIAAMDEYLYEYAATRGSAAPEADDSSRGKLRRVLRHDPPTPPIPEDRRCVVASGAVPASWRDIYSIELRGSHV